VGAQRAPDGGRGLTAGRGESTTMDETTPPKGVKTKLLGVVLIFLAMLDSMLSWRGGLGGTGFYVILFASGLALVGIGSVRGRPHKT